MSAENFVSQHETQTLTEFIRKLHKDSSRKLNQLDTTPVAKFGTNTTTIAFETSLTSGNTLTTY